MGTPEFPNLGKHCTAEDCNQIDFLPFTCDSCQQVFCLEHRSYSKHNCPKAGRRDVTVVICPLCARGVRLVPDQDPNITWETHVNSICDPSNYEKTTKKKKCPAPGCREILTFSNTIKCRDCAADHCLTHRFGPDHKCPGPKKPGTGSPFSGLLGRSKKEGTSSSSSSLKWTKAIFDMALNVRASAEAGMAKLGRLGEVEQCPQCNAKFSSVIALVEHVEKAHQRGNNRPGVKKAGVDVCPKCCRGFRDPVSLVEHIERDHGGTSKA